MEKLFDKPYFYWFHAINQIPRGSYNEEAISNFLKKFAEDRQLEVIQDEAKNIIIHKPASPGWENSPWVTLQGHMDMVCEKLPESTHDFSKDPIEMSVDGDWIKANKTTLGADDGIAVAYALALLDAKDIPHPNLEVIITTAEETGMDGAQALKAEDVKGEFLLNLDSETEGIFTLGCAGGADFHASFDLELENAGKEPVYQLDISGLKGGHSGQVIHEGRGNAIKILARILHQVAAKEKLHLVKLTGGSKHNAIPTQAQAIFQAGGQVEQVIKAAFEEVHAELQLVDPDLTYTLSQAQADQRIVLDQTQQILDYLFVLPHGVQSMSPAMHGLVQTSLNVAIVTQEKHSLDLQISIRSAVNSSKLELVDRLMTLTPYFGAQPEAGGQYPAWEFNPESPFIDKVQKIYQDLYQEEAKITAIHAGLECGLLKNIMPNTEMISFGPTMEDIHTPRERLNISSTNRVWDFLLKLLASFK